MIRREISDGLVAPGFEEGTVDLLKGKKGGDYKLLEIDAGYEPQALESRQVFGVTLQQPRNDFVPDEVLFADVVTARRQLSHEARRDLTVATMAVKYTQSNSVVCAVDGQGVVQQHLQRVPTEGAGPASLQLTDIRDLRLRHDGDAHQSAAADDDGRIVAARVDQRLGEGDGAEIRSARRDDVGGGRERREPGHLDVESLGLEQSGGLRHEQRQVGQRTAVRQRNA